VTLDREIRYVASPLTREMRRSLGPGIRVVPFNIPLLDEGYREVARLLDSRPDVLLRVYGAGSRLRSASWGLGAWGKNLAAQEILPLDKELVRWAGMTPAEIMDELREMTMSSSQMPSRRMLASTMRWARRAGRGIRQRRAR